MVINGGSRSGLAGYTGYLGWHLQRRETNELVFVREIEGVTARELTAALDEMAMMGAGSRSARPLYHANIDWRHDETLTPEQKRRAVDRLGEELGLAGQPRIVVEHVKEGREHLHAVWLRIDPETGKAISDSHNFRRHEIVARELEREFGLERVQGVHIERDGIERPARTPEPYEFAQAERTGLTPAEAKAEITGLWHGADTGQAFAAALDAAGWTLARGDKRDFVVLDRFGEAHSLARRIEGVKAAEVRARMADIDAAALPGVAEAREAMRDRRLEALEAAPEAGGMDRPAPEPEAIPPPPPEVEPTPVAYRPDFVLVPAMEIEPEPVPYVPNFVLVPGQPEIRPQPGPQLDDRLDTMPEPEPERARPAPREAQGPTLDMSGPEMATPEPEAARRPSYEVQPEPEPEARRVRLAEIIAAARARLAMLAERLDMAFARVRDQVLKPEAAARPTPEQGRAMDDNGAVIIEATRQPQPSPRQAARDMAEQLMGGPSPAQKPTSPEPTLEAQRSIWDDFKRRRMRRLGEGFEP